MCVQAFVNHSFENISSTGLALDLLLQFETILQRDTLKVALPHISSCCLDMHMSSGVGHVGQITVPSQHT